MGNLFSFYFLLKSLTYWAYSFLCKCVLMCDSSCMHQKFECFLFSFENPILVYDALWSKSLTLPSHISFPFLMTSYFCVFFVLFLLHTWQQQSFHMQKEGFHTIFLVSLLIMGFSTTLLWCFSETKEWYRCLTQIWAHYHLFQDFG